MCRFSTTHLVTGLLPKKVQASSAVVCFGLFVPDPGRELGGLCGWYLSRGQSRIQASAVREKGEDTSFSSRYKYDHFRFQISFSHLAYIPYMCYFAFLNAFAIGEQNQS